jgi:hypothetical protein
MSWPCLIIAAGCVCLFMIDACCYDEYAQKFLMNVLVYCCYDEDDECINILLLYAWSSFVHDVDCI